ncbi:MAG: septum formation initiator family protein [Treponema sp.]|jgi:cell division protein FtsB|nr:septum formation initiator family protein [Treponema sp.]
MRAVKYLIAPWAGVVVYVFLTMSSGAMGLSAFRQLERERDKQLANLEQLRLINQDLEHTKNSLLYDRDTLAVFARELGFASPDERFIRIVGLKGAYRQPNIPGTVYAARTPEFIPDLSLRILSCSVAAGLLMLMGALDLLALVKNRSARRNPPFVRDRL